MSRNLPLVVQLPPRMACPGGTAGNGCSLPYWAASPAWRSSELLANDAEIFVAGLGWTHAVCVSHWHGVLQTKPGGGSQSPATLI